MAKMIALVVAALAECLSDSSVVTGVNGVYYLDGVSVAQKFEVGIGTYTFTNVPSAHPLAFVADAGDANDFFTTSSDDAVNTLSKTVEGRDYAHYDETVTLTVTKSFGQLSMHCYYHGYMQGQHALTYNSQCDKVEEEDDDEGGGMEVGTIVLIIFLVIVAVLGVAGVYFLYIQPERELAAAVKKKRLKETELPAFVIPPL